MGYRNSSQPIQTIYDSLLSLQEIEVAEINNNSCAIEMNKHYLLLETEFIMYWSALIYHIRVHLV